MMCDRARCQRQLYFLKGQRNLSVLDGCLKSSHLQNETQLWLKSQIEENVSFFIFRFLSILEHIPVYSVFFQQYVASYAVKVFIWWKLNSRVEVIR